LTYLCLLCCKAEIEEKLNEPVDDGLQPKDVTDVVSQALAQKTKKNRFLVNVGLQSNATRVSAERDLEEELVVEKQTSNDLREVVKAQQQQMEEMMKKFQEAEAARAKQEEERAKQEESKKRQAEIDALIKTLVSMVPGCQATQ
jgi:DNA-binding helix-hairpin-helix protein with protein kinase domain